MIFEDAHWIDPTAWKCSAGRWTGSDPAGAADRDVPPGVRPAVARPPACDDPDLQSAEEREIEPHYRASLGISGLPTNIRQEIVERTDGIPLFVEEITKAVLEAKSQGAAGARGCGGSVTGPGGTRKLTCLADGAARPPRPGQGGGADRRGDRPGLLLCASFAPARNGGEAALRSTVSVGRFAVPEGLPPNPTTSSSMH